MSMWQTVVILYHLVCVALKQLFYVTQKGNLSNFIYNKKQSLFTYKHNTKYNTSMGEKQYITKDLVPLTGEPDECAPDTHQ